MILVLVEVIGANNQRVDPALVSPWEVAMNFNATFQPTTAEAIELELVRKVHALEWVSTSSLNEEANQVTFEVVHSAMVFAGIFAWDQLAGEINRLCGGR